MAPRTEPVKPPAAERIARLRERCLSRKTSAWRDHCLASARSLRASSHERSWVLRRGRLTRDRLAALALDMDDLEVLAGRPAPRPPDVSEAELEDARAFLATFEWPPGQSGHCALDLARLFELGLDALTRDTEARMKVAGQDRVATYRSFLLALEGFPLLIENAARNAEAAAADAPEWRRGELRAVADSCQRIAHQPPQSFRDAIQLTWLAELAVMHADDAWLVVPGRLDRTLRPFYERDIARGALTRDEALLLIEQLYLLINEYVPDGLAMSVMTGGRDAAGRDVTCELSFLCLEALRRTKLVYPTVGVCWHEGTPPALVDLAIELIGKGYSTPAFFGDETIRKGLAALGVPAEEACCYINSTCVEITPCGGSNVWVASPYFNTCGMLLEEIAAQAGSPTPASSFEELLNAYCGRLAREIEKAVAEQNGFRRRRRERGGKPLQSVLTRDCVVRGRDIDDGGARYNWVECSFVGLANLADSFHVVREEVFTRRRLSFKDLTTVLDADFAGQESVRQRFMNSYPKYGQDAGEVDELFGRMVAWVRTECSRHRVEPDGSPFVPGAFCWIMHERLGHETGATPDGRRKGTPFADGCGPAQGREKRGPTAAIRSTTSWDHSPMIGGLAYNMKFSSSLFATPGNLARLRDLVVTFLRCGGFETQINVVDAETLRKARAQPESYRDLIVRIGGYTDYFVRLSPEMQDEIMMRTEFGV
ncbi:MAG: hypothetical protein NTW87_19355 [Planctomycetota bacterium]|nr:hypothetical protein [Planctomycetota bacterium]